MREIETHHVPGVRSPKLMASDATTPGGAPVGYVIELSMGNTIPIMFQDGPVPQYGINGATNEVLLAIVIDRLKSFQQGPCPSVHNVFAITSCEDALRSLRMRTAERVARGVEGKLEA